LPDNVRQLLDSCLATGAIGATLYDGEGRVVYASPQSLAMLKRSYEDVIGKTATELGLQELDQARRKAMESGVPGQLRLQTASGNLECILTPIRNQLGETEFVYCSKQLVASLPEQPLLHEVEPLWSFALAGNGDGFWDWNIQADSRFYSDGYWVMLGFNPEESHDILEDFGERTHPDDKPTVLENLIKLFRGDEPIFSQEHRLRCKDGSYKWVLSRGKVVSHDAEGHPLRMIGIISDMTARREAVSALQIAEVVFEDSGEAIVVTDENNCIISVNRTFTEITGYSSDEVLGRNPSILSSRRQSVEFYKSMWHSLQEHGSWRGEIWNRRKNGEIYPEWLSIRRVHDESTATTRHIGIFSDLSERKDAVERIHRLSHFDSLTSLPNRLLMEEHISQAIAYAQRHKLQLAVLSVDIDHFKHINDTLGYLAGDQLLQLIAQRLQDCVRRGQDTVSRLKGDGFLILLPDLDMNAAAQLAQSIITALSMPYPLEKHEASVTTSIGIGIFPGDGADTSKLIENATAAMYYAKENGHNNYKFYAQDMNASTLQRMTLENSLRQAMEQNEFLIHYQPLIDLKSGQVVGAEALLRWKHPEMDMVSPSVFIELAEESGVIIPLGEWMIGVVCRQIHTWQQEGTRIIPISVNISLRQFQQSDLPQKIEALLKDNNVDPFFLEIELTESTVMQDVDAAAKMLQRVKKRGIRLAIDDFGTGYSSLVHLKRFHIDKLKIDQSLVRELVDNADDSAIVRAIISMAHNLRLVVVAEGVETRKQLDFLKVLHCDQIQGYFFSEALPAESFASLLREGKALSA
jgi:diguanylate cyclase (GGDEF)-like protein/PAS domain S-box-containing protein